MRNPDECFRCGRPVPWDRAVNVPTARGRDRVCCYDCAFSLGARQVCRMSWGDRNRVTRYVLALRGRAGLPHGMTPRRRRKEVADG